MNQMTRPDDMRLQASEQPRYEPLDLSAEEKYAGIVRAHTITLERALIVLFEDVKGNMAQGFSSPLPGRVMDYERALEHARRGALHNMGRARERAERASQPKDDRDRRRVGRPQGPAVRYGG